MPVPTAYTEAALRTFMVTDLSDVGVILGWTTATLEVSEAVYDVALWLGVSDVASYTASMDTLRKLARVAIWRAAVKALGARYTFAEDQQSFQRSDLQKHAREALALAEADAATTGLVPGYSIGVDTLVYPSADPYAYYDDDARVVVTP